MHQSSSFVTLTFSDEHLPDNYSVDVRDLQLFMKRLRKFAGSGIRFLACGEYGDNNLRPHYHLCLFGTGFESDRKVWRRTQSGHLAYRSESLERLWPYGHCELGALTYQSASYTARYVLKKVTGKSSSEYYTRVHPLTGEIVQVKPEFIVMSRKPGIGFNWLEKWKRDVFPSDFLIIDGKKVPVPRAYMRVLDDDEDVFFTEKDRVIAKRLTRGNSHAEDRTPERLAVREEVARLRNARLKREL